MLKEGSQMINLSRNLFLRRERQQYRGKMARTVVSKVGVALRERGIDVESILDMGATRSFVSLELAEKPGYIRYEKRKEVLLAAKDKKAHMVGELMSMGTMLEYELILSAMSSESSKSSTTT